MSTSGTPALLTVTGPDRPGVTARVMSVLAAHDGGAMGALVRACLAL